MFYFYNFNNYSYKDSLFMPTAVITGATKGIGKAIAEKLLQQGFDVAICARSTNDLRLLHNTWELQFPDRKVFMQNVDMSVKAQVKDFARNVLNNFKQIDILVNNAGIFLPGKIATEADEQLESVMATNVYSAYHLTRALLPRMKEARTGHIFNICSVAALQAYPNGGSYSISKYALLGFTENLRYELKEEGIKVTAISPGAVWSNSWNGSGITPERIMQAQDVAEVLWSSFQLSTQATVEHIIMRPQLGDL
jgi:short-subunit dehydrogenase